MLKIDKKQDGKCVRFSLSGEIDSFTAPEFEREVRDLENVDEVTLDLQNLAYISSAGLRVIMTLKRRLAGRPLKFENIGIEVREVFDMTGSSALLGI